MVQYHPRIFGLVVVLAIIPVSRAMAVDEQGNAADLYRQAAESLPRSPVELKAYENWSTQPLDKGTLDLVARLAPTRRLFRRASNSQKLDWGWDYRKGPDLRIPELQSFRSLSEAAALWTRVDFEQHRFDEGIDSSFDVLLFARRLESAPLVILSLVGGGIEAQETTVVAAYLPQISELRVAQMESRLALLPSPRPVTSSLAAEMDASRGYLAKIAQATGKADNPTVQTALAEDLRQLQSLDNAAVRLVGLNPQQAAAQEEGYNAKVAAVPQRLRPFVFNDPAQLSYVDAYNREHRELFRTALDLRAHGPGAIKSSKDPLDGKPFAYSAVAGGFRLQSDLVNPKTSQPVDLSVGPDALK